MIIKDLHVAYKDKVVLDSLSIDFPENSVTCIMGESGCGKTTLLNSIADIIPYSGIIKKNSSKISYVFQNPVLLDHLTVEKNIQFVLESQYSEKKKIQDISDSMLKKVGLFEEKNNYPKQLSGGMAQRVALARAFAYKPDIMLMDEPFKGLDISLKKRIIELFKDLNREYRQTTILVTHDIDEAILLADKIVLLGERKVLYEKSIPDKTERNIVDFPEIRGEIYKLL